MMTHLIAFILGGTIGVMAMAMAVAAGGEDD